MLIRIPKIGAIIKPFSKKTKKRKSIWSSEELEKISKHYNLGTWQARTVFSGGNSSNLLIQTPKGKKVLKKYIWDLKSTIYEHSILDHLKKQKFPVPKLVRNKIDKTFTNIDREHYALYEYIGGDCPDNYHLTINDRLKLSRKAGVLLGSLHTQTANFIPDGEKLNGFMPDGKKLYRSLSWHINILNRYEKLVQTTDLLIDREHFLLSILKKVKSGLVDVGKHYKDSKNGLPKLIIHGDYSPHNLIVNKHGIRAILDFEGACLNLKVEDISYGIITFCWNKNQGINKELCKEFVSGYQINNHMSDIEIASIPDIMRWIYLKKIVRPIVHMVESNLGKKIRGDELSAFRFKFDRACWFEKNKQRIFDFLT